jgi:hypothetical protein
MFLTIHQHSFNSYSPIPSCNVANWAQDGEVLLDDDKLFKFFVRSLLQANVYFICQLPLRFNAQVTPDDFL